MPNAIINVAYGQCIILNIEPIIVIEIDKNKVGLMNDSVFITIDF